MSISLIEQPSEASDTFDCSECLVGSMLLELSFR